MISEDTHKTLRCHDGNDIIKKLWEIKKWQKFEDG